MDRNKGFTLIELLVVIAIIGILSTVVLAFLSGARNKAFDAKVKSEMRQLINAAGIFYAVNGVYDADGIFSGGDCVITSPTRIVLGEVFADTQVERLIKDLPGARCWNDKTSYLVIVPFKAQTNKAWCADSQNNTVMVKNPPPPNAGGASGFNCTSASLQ